ncbi:hypothetical protein BLS_001844 [Venturia inaequalis]|uniref:Uncharacterized protein n=1 Tax=Venturia inaequalis TaxID=5025 RepID=A0A8H3U1G0_VENIN|nr:hypothetical protein BLS_001844 [Venturia inaequalis]
MDLKSFKVHNPICDPEKLRYMPPEQITASLLPSDDQLRAHSDRSNAPQSVNPCMECQRKKRPQPTGDRQQSIIETATSTPRKQARESENPAAIPPVLPKSLRLRSRHKQGMKDLRVVTILTFQDPAQRFMFSERPV